MLQLSGGVAVRLAHPAVHFHASAAGEEEGRGQDDVNDAPEGVWDTFT